MADSCLAYGDGEIPRESEVKDLETDVLRGRLLEPAELGGIVK